MANPKTTRLCLTTRRALNKWIRENLHGECRVIALSPKPFILGKNGGARPVPAPRVGTIEISVRPDQQPAHTRVTARRFRLRIARPEQWCASVARDVPFTFWSQTRATRLWGEVGLECGSMWLSGDELVVEELTPEIQMVAPRWNADSYRYTFDDWDLMPPPEDWIRFATDAGFRMVQVDGRGFAVTPETRESARGGFSWQFAERAPRNLLHPLQFEVWFGSGSHFSVSVSERDEAERGLSLKTSLVERCERVPGLIIESGNCRFTHDQWRELLDRAQREPMAVPERKATGAVGEGAVVVSLDERRRRN